MASLTNINEIRINISDPGKIIKITLIPDVEHLPENPQPQTLYYVVDDGLYYQCDKKNGAIPSDYYNPELYLSNIVIGSLIDTHGMTKAAYKAVKRIASKLASDLLIVKNDSGTTSTQYIKLLNLYKYYKNIVADLVEDEKESEYNSSGRVGRMKTPRIAGGNL